MRVVTFMRNWITFFSWRKHSFAFMRLNNVENEQGQVVMSQLTILGLLGWNIRLHYFYRDDHEYFHSHPRGFVSLCLKGRYHEQMLDGKIRWVRPMTLTVRKASDTHRVSPMQTPCITFVLTTPVIRQWERIDKT